MIELLSTFSLINDIEVSKSDAVILLEGDGLNRIEESCKLVINDIAPVLVFSGGIDNESYGSYNYEKCKKEIEKFNLRNDQLILELKSKHTREQAENIIALAQEKKWSKIILVASNFHIYRVYLTFLKVLEEKGLTKKINLLIKSVHLSWFEELKWGRRLDLLRDEILKIEEYQKKGHIPTYESVVEYFQWKELQ